MRIFQGFLIIVVSAILWMLPVSDAIYNFRTDLRTETFTVVTAPAETTKDEVLFKALYDDDTAPITFSSTLITDVPAAGTYVSATKTLTVTGLTASKTRTLTIEYPYDALHNSSAVGRIMTVLPFVWILLIISLPVIGLIAIWKGWG